eukprot:scaffold7397_cov108-Isochrysis_galbana.AAC.1
MWLATKKLRKLRIACAAGRPCGHPSPTALWPLWHTAHCGLPNIEAVRVTCSKRSRLTPEQPSPRRVA